ncbi:hypothetical protein PU629_14705 [Pullulanibacillus sp. KACC 23026]|uniref:hypothetical protein n=1 Tax=Pullulanibacillus sp. KACC 23026 TaxID=3028315 RepID=UPI0023B04727|nr:hypothetical protein [Pullulanibacillus sp. KACC 23026]WEG11406.1 hypothetical protein PU629_14705 [Pullulanibacillus sp. KACC 23026]
MDHLNSYEPMQALPPRRVRHGRKKVERATRSARKSPELELIKPKLEESHHVSLDGAATKTKLLEADHAETESPSEELANKREPRGSFIVANVIMWGFLLLVGGILFYTIRHY